VLTSLSKAPRVSCALQDLRAHPTVAQPTVRSKDDRPKIINRSILFEFATNIHPKSPPVAYYYCTSTGNLWIQYCVGPNPLELRTTHERRGCNSNAKILVKRL
jgi:hypothetical protein